MELVHLTICTVLAILGIPSTHAAHLPTPETASDNTITQQRTSLPFNTSLQSFKTAQELGARFPPGYNPHHPYIYRVYYSPITLHCHFEHTPTFNPSQTDTLFRRIFTLYTNPLYRNLPLSIGLPRIIDWRQGTAHDTTTLLFEVPLSVRDGEPWPVTRGDFLNTAVGVNRLRLDYPMLTIGCEVWKDERVEEGALGGVLLAVGIR
ncbi:MAG: hypothetical protein Q9204_006076 [Flavoplaca sp. TL-2023a]